jgi:hypothetical protein
MPEAFGHVAGRMVPTFRFRFISGLFLAALLAFGQASPAAEAKAKPKAAAPTKPAATLDVPLYQVPAATLANLQKALPSTVAKLQKRKPVHVVVVGDELVRMTAHDATDGNALLAWPGQFVAELAREFYYPGGVRVIQPEKGKPAKVVETRGAEITMRVFSVRGGTMQKAMAMLAAYGGEAPPDLLIVGFGMHDAASGADLMSYAKSLQQVIDIMKPRGVDVLIAGPVTSLREPQDVGISDSTAIAGVAHDIAAEAGCTFVNLGDLRPLIQLGNDDIATPDQTLEVVLHQYRDFFQWPDGFDALHPKPALHQKLGQAAYRVLAKGPMPVPWKITTTKAEFVDGGRCKATITIENATNKKTVFNLAPLKLPCWEPESPALRLELKGREKKELQLTWQRHQPSDSLRFPPMAGHEAAMRLPLLVAGGGTARVEEVRAALQPVAMIWKLDSLFNQQGSVTIDNLVLNTTGTDLKGITWSAEWNGQKHEGKFDLAKGASTTLALAFDLPKSPGPRRIALPLMLMMNVNGTALRWERAMEASQNFGIGQEIPLIAAAASKATVTMEAQATATALTLTFDLAGIALQNGPEGLAMQADLNLDARSYGSRLTMGSTEAITATVGTEDGNGTVGRIAPWAFGTGYGMKFDEESIAAQLSTQGTHRQFTLTLPRSYLYLHEWAIGNGNSQLGINARLRFWQKDGGFTPANTFSVTLNGRASDDAEGNAVLELTDKPTARWTVVVW